MNATEARAASQANLKSTVITPYIEHIDARIKEATAKGRFKITDPHVINLENNRIPKIAHGEEVQAIKQHYVSQGYKWEDHANPDPGHPCSSEYITLSW